MSNPQKVRNLTIQRNPLKWDNFHISSIEFSDEDKSLQTANNWTDIPGFCVITGLNGSGKSHLLEAINRNFLLCEDGINYAQRSLYLPAYENEHISASTRLDYDSISLQSFWKRITSKETIEEKIKYCNSKLTRGKYLQDSTKIKVDLFLNNLRSILRENDNSIEYNDFLILYQSYFPYLFPGGQPDDILSRIFRRYSEDVTRALKFLKSQIRKSKENDLPPTNAIDIQEPDESDFIEALRDPFLSMEFYQKIPSPPFEKINRILQEYGFQIKINENIYEDPHFWITRPGSSSKIEYWELSSGEKKIIELLAWFYSSSSDELFDKQEKTPDDQKDSFDAQENSSEDEEGISDEEDELIRRMCSDKEKQPVSIMLLDEPDRHLDPEFIVLFLKIIYEEFYKKMNVQVIMTTHRPDTITLFPEEKNIFLLDRKPDGSRIAPASRNEVLRRLTKNLQNYTRTSTKVYTEATTDADFYCGAYYSLLDCSNKQMLMNQKELIFEGNKEERITKSLLSREYPLLFISSGISRYNPGDEGGISQVIVCVKRDKSILLNKSKEKQDNIEPLSDPQAYNSFGIIDHDHGQNSAKLKAAGVVKRIAIPKVRYSLENFVLDPIILCRALTPEEAGEYVNSFLEKDVPQSSDEAIKETKDSVMRPVQAQTQSFNNENAEGAQIPGKKTSVTPKNDKVLEKKNLFIRICRNVREELDKIINQLNQDVHSNISSDNLQSCLDEYFDFFNRACDVYSKKLEKKTQENANLSDKQKLLCTEMQGEIENLRASCTDLQSIGNLSKVLSRLIEIIPKPKNKGGKKGKGKGKGNENENNSKEVEDPMEKLQGDRLVKICILKGFNRFITVEYPNKFLKIRGHDLVYGITPKKNEVAEPIEAITNYVYTYGLTFIQEELIDVILDLNNLALGKEPEDEKPEGEKPEDEKPGDEKSEDEKLENVEPENVEPEYEDENLFI